MKPFLLYLFLLFFFQLSFSQNKDTLSVSLILKQIEKQHQVNFSYLEETINDIYTTIPTKELSLTEKLDFLSKNTRLKFKNIKNNFIVVIKNDYIQGRVIDAISKQSIADAVVKDIKTNRTTLTNQEGYFTFKITENSSIEITHIGYKKTQFDTEKLPNIIALEPNTLSLSEVTNTFYLTKGIDKKAASSFVITPQKMTLLPGVGEPDVFSTIQQIPGISSNNQLLSEINIRGGAHHQNLFLWNNVRLYQTSHFFGLISALNPNTFQTIKVFKNGSSSDYSNATSGVINIDSRHKNSQKPDTSVGINLLSADVVSTIDIKNSSLKIAARRSVTDFLSSPTYKTYADRVFQNTVITNYSENSEVSIQSNEKFSFYDALLQWQKNINDKHTIFVDALVFNNALNILQTQNSNTEALSKISNLKQNSYIVSTSITSDWNERISTNLQIYSSNYRILSKQDFLNSEQTLNQENNVLDLGIIAKKTYRINEKYALNNGINFLEVGVLNFDYINSPRVSIKEKNVIKSFSHFTDLQYSSKSSPFFYKIGFRQNYLTKLHKYIFEPNIIFSYTTKKGLKISYIYMSRSINLYIKKLKNNMII